MYLPSSFYKYIYLLIFRSKVKTYLPSLKSSKCSKENILEINLTFGFTLISQHVPTQPQHFIIPSLAHHPTQAPPELHPHTTAARNKALRKIVLVQDSNPRLNQILTGFEPALESNSNRIRTRARIEF